MFGLRGSLFGAISASRSTSAIFHGYSVYMKNSPDPRHLMDLLGRRRMCREPTSSPSYLFVLGLRASGTKALEQTHPLLVSRRLSFLEVTKEDHPLRRVRKIRRRQVCVEDAQRTVMAEASPCIPPHLPGSVRKSYQLDCSALFVISRRPSSRERDRGTTIPHSAYCNPRRARIPPSGSDREREVFLAHLLEELCVSQTVANEDAVEL